MHTSCPRSTRRGSRGPTSRWADQVITGSHAVAEIFERRYGRRIGVVPYGVENPSYGGSGALDEFGLEPRKYILFVGRLEPENNPHLLVEAFARLDHPLIPRESERSRKLYRRSSPVG